MTTNQWLLCFSLSANFVLIAKWWWSRRVHQLVLLTLAGACLVTYAQRRKLQRARSAFVGIGSCATCGMCRMVAQDMVQQLDEQAVTTKGITNE